MVRLKITEKAFVSAAAPESLVRARDEFFAPAGQEKSLPCWLLLTPDVPLPNRGESLQKPERALRKTDREGG